ncbi:DUF58 domain-containing protein [Sessilibacter sp. MAH1]
MRPTEKLLKILLVWGLLALITAVLRIFSVSAADLLSSVWVVAGIFIVIVAFVDYFSVGKIRRLGIRQQIPSSLALGNNTKCSLKITNTLARDIDITAAFAPNTKIKFEGFPLQFLLKKGTFNLINYHIKPVDRGNTTIAAPVFRIKSRNGLWDYKTSLGNDTDVKIYPNFSPIAQLSNMGVERQIQQLGIHLSQRRGEGMEFKQLREFVEGDSLRQIDWKATSKARRPISREYQDEKNQEIFFLLDCGRRLRHKDDELSHFDYALNAILLTAYIAIRQGDSAGFFSFAGDNRYLSPVKGVNGVNTLLNNLYDIQSTLENTDFLKLAEDFTVRHKRRSLVVLVSNIREEDHDDLIKATRLLSKKHIVLVASLKEASLEHQLQEPVVNFDSSIAFAATHKYLHERSLVIKKLRSAGVFVIDTLPEFLHVRLVSEYFRLKRSHLL